MTRRRAIPTIFATPDSRIPSRVKPKDRVCESEDCKVVLSIYNDTTICAKCEKKIPLMDLPVGSGKYL